jgi:surface antigen|tara:strand:+ start:209 stop:532 length:324 start_codon:yes stop_codon:yes gene_type:complete
MLLAGCSNMGMGDRTVHSEMFIDHLNNMPSGKSSFLLWHNPTTGNKGDIKITRSYIKNGFKCADYTSTVDIKDTFPIYSMTGRDRSTEFGTACMLPDGRWKIIERVL